MGVTRLSPELLAIVPTLDPFYDKTYLFQFMCLLILRVQADNQGSHSLRYSFPFKTVTTIDAKLFLRQGRHTDDDVRIDKHPTTIYLPSEIRVN